MTELLPCPFCGSDDIMEGVYYADGSLEKRGAVRCAGCGVRAPADAWNRRAAHAQCEGDHCEIRTPAIVQRIKEACAQVADRAAAKAGNPNLDQPLMDVRRSTALEIAASIRALIPAPRTPAATDDIDWDTLAEERLEQRPRRSPAEGERQRCMEILEDVPGETLVDRVNRLKDWHQELSNSYHDAIAEARTERDQSIALVEEANAKKGGFAFPKIVINWDEINAMQFANSRVALMAKLDRFMSEECKDAAYWSSNHFTRSEMYVLHELLKAASPEHTSTVSPSDPDAGLPTYQDVRGILKQPSKGEHADYVHGRLYAYDATSQTFDEAPGKFEGDRVTILQSDFEGLMADRRELKQLRTQAGHNRPRWRHVRRGGSYTEICRAELQASRDVVEGLTMVVYRGDDGKCWVRHEDEFEDGRFEQIGPAHSSTERQDG